jgi:hypothetical protein
MSPQEATMAVTRNIGMLVLAIWLILTGLMGLGVAIGNMSPILAILALIAGVAILLGR